MALTESEGLQRARSAASVEREHAKVLTASSLTGGVRQLPIVDMSNVRLTGDQEHLLLSEYD